MTTSDLFGCSRRSLEDGRVGMRSDASSGEPYREEEVSLEASRWTWQRAAIDGEKRAVARLARSVGLGWLVIELGFAGNL